MLTIIYEMNKSKKKIIFLFKKIFDNCTKIVKTKFKYSRNEESRVYFMIWASIKIIDMIQPDTNMNLSIIKWNSLFFIFCIVRMYFSTIVHKPVSNIKLYIWNSVRLWEISPTIFSFNCFLGSDSQFILIHRRSFEMILWLLYRTNWLRIFYET